MDDLDFPFPVNEEEFDTRLNAGAIVVTAKVREAEKAYPVEAIGDAVVNDFIAGSPVLFVSRDGSFGRAFSRTLGERVLTFEQRGDGLFDTQTQSRWDLSGSAVEGALAGSELEALKTRRGFWFSIALASPGLQLYEP